MLRSVRHAAHHGFHRFVFDVSLPRGDAHHIPLAVATYHAHDFSIDIDIEGIDRDVTGHGIHTPVKVARGPVARFERLGHDHHHHARYRIQLTRGARYRLHALHAPVRIVLDVEKSDLER